MKRFLTICAAGLLLGLAKPASAQDIHFSQFYENAILRNPALCGIFSEEYKIGMDYRNQWPTVGVPYSTVMLSGETRVLVNREVGDYLSFGMVMSYDKAGSINFRSMQLFPAIAFNKAMQDDHHSYLSVGFTGGYLYRTIDQSLMKTSNQYQNGNYNPDNSTGEINQYQPSQNYSLGAGVSLNSSLDIDSKFNYYLGASIYHINHPTQIFAGGDVLSKLPMKLQFSAGFYCPMGEQFGLTLHGNYSLQHPYSQFIGGGMFTWRNMPPGLPSNFAFHFGAFYRVNDAIIPTVKLEFSKMTIGISHDVNNSTLGVATNGAAATEFTLYIKGSYAHRQDPRDPIMCPRFEGVNNLMK